MKNMAAKSVGNQSMMMEPVHKEELADDSARNIIKMEQFQSIMTNIVRNALEENNQALGKEVGSQVGEKVLKEMNYLMREQDDAEEERFRRLDAAIRAHGKGKKIKADKPRRAGRVSRKEKRLNPNLGI